MKILKLTAILFLLQPINLLAQNIGLKDVGKDLDGKIVFCKPADSTPANPGNERSFLKKILNTNKQFELQLLRTNDQGSSKHNFYGFMLHGIPIVGADYGIHSTKGNIDFATGTLPGSIQSNVNAIPKLSYEESRKQLNLQLRSEHKNNLKTTFEYTHRGLVWVSNKDTLTLAYKIEVNAKNLLLHGLYYIDALSGRQIGFSSFICNFTGNEIPPNAAGTTQTLYSGSQPFITDAITNGFRLRENRNNVNILTLNANFMEDREDIATTATDFLDNDNNWLSSEHPNDVQAQDVHWATEKVLDYFRIQHNRNSLDNNGIQARSFVHVNIATDLGIVPMDNAYYYGNPFISASTHSMYYGDGAIIGNPWVSLDVVGHEMGHGVDEYTSQLIRNSLNESAALGEALSDIWGATIEHWAAPTKQTWLIGEEIMRNGFSCVRSLRSPKTEGYRTGFATEGNYPDTYRYTFYDNTGNDAHRNATVVGHWYYILVMGLSGTNDLGNAFSVNGIGFEKAASIVYKTQTEFLNVNANFGVMRFSTIEAARALYGDNSCEVKEVTNAWYAVGIGTAFSISLPQANLSISGAQSFCSSIGLTLNNVPCGLTATWSASPAGIVNFSCQNCNQVTVTKVASGNVTITATITSNNTSQSVSSSVIHAGEYTSGDYTLSGNNGSMYWCPNQTMTFSIAGPNSSNFNYNWTIPSGFTTVSSGNTYIVIRAPSSTYPPSGTLSASFTETCGSPLTKYLELAYSPSACATSCYTYSPNPAPYYLNVSVVSACQGLKYIKKIELIRVATGQSVYYQDYSSLNISSTSITMTSFVAGTYSLRIFDGTAWVSYNIVH
ncbi:MAG TPA: M4 family metallopeptidase [Chitinophagaceae bacterium]|nr:M4 family metallopeptidase [Chitinophagaceae bacterium]